MRINSFLLLPKIVANVFKHPLQPLWFHRNKNQFHYFLMKTVMLIRTVQSISLMEEYGTRERQETDIDENGAFLGLA